jgi:integrase
MATLDCRKGGFRVIFYYQGRRFQHSLKTSSKREAAQLKTCLERSLDLLYQGVLHVPEGADLAVFLLSGGQTACLPPARKSLSLGSLLKDYRKGSKVGKEESTRSTERVHIKHLLRHLGRRTRLQDIPERLQHYVNSRSAERGRSGEPIGHLTIKKELGTLSSIWNKWALRAKLVAVPLTLRNLEYPKKRDKPPFQTWAQIERRIQASNLQPDERAELWDALFLTAREIEEFLAHVRTVKYRWKNSSFPWIFPMVAFAAYTGARRSEILRSRLEDLDFEGGEIAIREKKKDTSREFTFRHVPMVARLKAILLEWRAVHPGGPFTFCRTPGDPFTGQMATHYLQWSIDGSKWEVIKGWHVFRHSLISNLASAGVSERVLMAIAGHLNRETTRRYAHLVPSTIQDAMGVVFGAGELPVADAL